MIDQGGNNQTINKSINSSQRGKSYNIKQSYLGDKNPKFYLKRS